MIFVSELANTAMLKSLRESGIGRDRALSLSWIREEGALKMALKIDELQDSDWIIYHRDSPVLIVDHYTENALGNAAIDIHEGDKGAKLVFQRFRRK